MAEEAKSVVGKIKDAINKLPFENLAKKVPALAKFAGYANYAFCALVLVVIGAIASGGGSGVQPAVNELKKINDQPSRYWIKFITENGINAIDGDGDILLVEAAKSNNLPLVKACVKSGADVNLYVKGKAPAVSYAVQNNNLEMLKYLIQENAVIYGENIDAVYIACKLPPRDDEIYKILIENYPKSFFKEGGDFFKYESNSHPTVLVLQGFQKHGYNFKFDDRNTGLLSIIERCFSDNKDDNKFLVKFFTDCMSHFDMKTLMGFGFVSYHAGAEAIESQFSTFKVALSSCKNLSEYQESVDKNLVDIISQFLTPTHKEDADVVIKNFKELLPILQKNKFDFTKSRVLTAATEGVRSGMDSILGTKKQMSAYEEFFKENPEQLEEYNRSINKTVKEIAEDPKFPLIDALLKAGFTPLHIESDFAGLDERYENYAEKNLEAYKLYMSDYYGKKF